MSLDLFGWHPLFVPYLSGKTRLRQRRRDFSKVWAATCKTAGVAERVAMKVTSHKTRAVFDGYHIVSPGDLQDVARKLSGTFQGTSGSATIGERPATR